MQQRYPRQSHPPPPPQRKKRPGLLITLVVLLVLAGTGVGFYLYAHRDGGKPPTGHPLPPGCEVIGEATLARARTTNVEKPERGFDDAQYRCNWIQTAGRDGEGTRELNLLIWTGGLGQAGRPQRESLSCIHSTFATEPIGDEHCLDGFDTTAHRNFAVHAFQGEFTIMLSYTGADVGFFDEVTPSEQEFHDLAIAAAREALDNLNR